MKRHLKYSRRCYNQSAGWRGKHAKGACPLLLVRIQKGFGKDEIIERRHKRLVKASKVKRAGELGRAFWAEKGAPTRLRGKAELRVLKSPKSWGDKSLRKRVLR